MLFLRLLGKTLLFAAFAALAYDGVRTVASPGEGLLFTSLATHLKNIPQARETMESFFLSHAPLLWNDILEPMLVLPVSILFGAAGALMFLIGYRRPLPEIPED